MGTVRVPCGNNLIYHVTEYAGGIFRVRVGQATLAPSTLERYAVLQLPEPVEPSLAFGNGQARFTGQAATLVIDAGTGGISLLARDEQPLIRTDQAPSIDKGFSISFQISPDEPFYGLGDVNRDSINRRGVLAPMWVRNVSAYIPIPFIMSPRGWGIMLNTTWRHRIDVARGESDTLTFAARQGELDLFFFTGDSLAEMLSKFTGITGRPSLLPQWAYGLTYVCNQEVDARGMVDEAMRFRQEGIPCDLIGLEPGWMSKHYDTSIEKRWHDQRFFLPPWAQSGPATFFGVLERLGFKLSLWLCCEYDLSYEEERQAGAQQAASSDGAMSRHADDFEQDDQLGPEPRRMDSITKIDEPWFTHLEKFVDQGVSAFKLDGAYQVNDHPDRLYGNGMIDEEMHNLYPTLWSKQQAIGFERKTGRRAMAYTSGGYIGVQRYSATWAGDTGGGPRPLVSMLNLGLSGVSNVACDMDVFTPAGIHFGFLQTWSQVNSWAYWRQPWLLDEKLKTMFKAYATMRYALLPYLYTAAHQAQATGLPVMRAMALMFERDPACRNLMHQYMLGDWLLTAAFQESVYLPAGPWIDYWTDEWVDGGQDHLCRIPADRGGPLFVRGGAIIPSWPPVQWVGERVIDHLTLDIYPAGRSEFELIEDDGVSLAYREGSIARTKIRSDASSRGVTVHIGPTTADAYDGQVQDRTWTIRLHLQSGLHVAAESNGWAAPSGNVVVQSIRIPTDQLTSVTWPS